MSKLGYLGSFAVGGGIGALVAWIFTRKKYEKLVEDEIKSVKEEFTKESHIVIVKNQEEADKIIEEKQKTEDQKKYQKKLMENHYTSYKQALDEVKKTVKEQEIIFPYPIEPDEQGENGFTKETLIYYEGDGTLADEFGRIFDRPDDTVGLNNLDDFGKSDVMYIRNETDEVDYEVIRDVGTYAEAHSNPNYILPETD